MLWELPTSEAKSLPGTSPCAISGGSHRPYEEVSGCLGAALSLCHHWMARNVASMTGLDALGRPHDGMSRAS